jgi:hypothetical protein
LGLVEAVIWNAIDDVPDDLCHDSCFDDPGLGFCFGDDGDHDFDCDCD